MTGHSLAELLLVHETMLLSLQLEPRLSAFRIITSKSTI